MQSSNFLKFKWAYFRFLASVFKSVSLISVALFVWQYMALHVTDVHEVQNAE